MAKTFMMAIGRHRVEIRRRLTLGGDDGRPPLVADCRDIQKIEQLERHVGLQQRVRLAFIEHAAAEIGEPLLLECRCGDRGIRAASQPRRTSVRTGSGVHQRVEPFFIRSRHGAAGIAATNRCVESLSFSQDSRNAG